MLRWPLVFRSSRMEAHRRAGGDIKIAGARENS